MWTVTNKTPFATHGYPARDAAGAEHWALAIRATFDLTNGALPRLAETQTPIRLVPLYDDNAEEMLEEADMMPFRMGCDVVVAGHAHPPRGTRPDAFPVRLRVGTIDKTLICHGPRRQVGNRIIQDGPAATTRLSWRNALGGPDIAGLEDPLDANPLGMGYASYPLPEETALELPLISDDSGRPVGFGALPPHVMPRRGFAGTFDEDWERRRAPRFPADFDARFYNAAPPDQVAELKGGETLHLDGLDPGGAVSFRLPQAILTARTRIDADVIEHRFRLISVYLDLDASRLSMIWNSAIPCAGRDGRVDGSVVRLRQISGVERTSAVMRTEDPVA
ncbi:DUF2169 domain-containing protein [Gymnodinialimonas sp. 2305UL16-5]|uniref:DUF2169 family type VI secretion system accessory protein n=1 Tax=Gymnodinialimonas mytili TaxID=3126503 RepID=UPI0030A1F1D8